jgi:hypothetical protein
MRRLLGLLTPALGLLAALAPDFPHVLPSPLQAPNLIGGVYQVRHSKRLQSSLEVPPVSGAAGSRALPSATHTPLGCPAATGRLKGSSLGPIRLGMTRARARRAFVQSSTRGRRYMDFFCLSGPGIRVGYPAPALLRMLRRSERGRDRGRVVLALTANRHYALHGVRPGMELARVARYLHVSRPFHVGKNFWYLTPGRPVRGVLKVRRRFIQEIGIAQERESATRAQDRRFFRSFS